MDNVGFHGTQDVIDRFERVDHELTFLPLYSLFLDPMEEALSKGKSFVRWIKTTK